MLTNEMGGVANQEGSRFFSDGRRPGQWAPGQVEACSGRGAHLGASPQETKESQTKIKRLQWEEQLVLQ